MILPYATGDQLIVLRAEVDDDDHGRFPKTTGWSNDRKIPPQSGLQAAHPRRGEPFIRYFIACEAFRITQDFGQLSFAINL
jgi:hypothetical protein